MPYTKSDVVRATAFFALLLGGYTAMIALRDTWPILFHKTSLALPVAGFALALLVLSTGAYGVARKALLAVTVLVAFVWIWLAFSEVVRLLQNALGTFADGRRMGAPPVASAQAALNVFHSLTPAQARAYWACVYIGAPPIMLMIGAVLATITKARGSRIEKDGPWRAQWMEELKLRYLRTLKTGLPLGLKDGKILRYKPAPAKGWRAGHHAVIAGTRAGKGVSAVIPAIIEHEGPVVVLDVKGENFAVTRRHRQSLGRRVAVLNPFGVIEDSCDTFNPLDYVRPSHLVRDIDAIAEGLVRPEPGAGAHFVSLATQIIAATIEVVVTKRPGPERTLNTVADILFAADFEDKLKAWASDPATYGRRPSQAAATILATGENERGGIRSTLKKAFEWARSDEMRAFLETSSASFEHVLGDKLDLFIVVPLDQLDAQAVFMRLMINVILGMAVRQDGRSTVEKPILLVLDEFVRLGRMEKLLNIANVAAGAGIEALFVTQDKGQIETVYGKNDTDSLLGSCVTIRVFGLGRAESHTAEWVVDALGDQTIITRSKQTSTQAGEKARVSTAEHRQKLMTVDQILEMPADEIVCLIGSQRPVRLKAIVSHAHPETRGKLDRNPMWGDDG